MNILTIRVQLVEVFEIIKNTDKHIQSSETYNVRENALEKQELQTGAFQSIAMTAMSHFSQIA